MKCRKRTKIKVQILFGREIVECNAIHFSIKLDRTVTWIQVGGLNKLSKSLDRPWSAFWSFLHYYQGMHVDQPIFMTETEKQRNKCKISRAVWLEILKLWRWGCGGLWKSRVGLLSEMKGKASRNYWKINSKEVQAWSKLGGGFRPILIKIGAVG